jgi:hypothetical protein
VEAGGISWNHGDLGILAIWPKFGSRGGAIPLIAPPPLGGMVAYPTYSALGIDVQTLYTPSIGFGRQVQVQSSLQAACEGRSRHIMKRESAGEMKKPPHPRVGS